MTAEETQGASALLARVEALREEMGRAADRLAAAAREAAEAAAGTTPTLLDPDRRELRVDEQAVPLTPLEFQLMQELLRSPGRVCGRADLLVKATGSRLEGQRRNMDAHINRLRAKLGASDWRLQTVRGIGYRWDSKEASCQ